MTPTTESIFLTGAPLGKKLERARDELLDLSARNRLLNMPRSSRTSRTIEVIDENAAEIFRLLVRESKSFTFLPGRAQKGAELDEESDELDGPLEGVRDEGRDDRGLLNRHLDTKLQTGLTPAGLQKRLLELFLDAKTLEDEQGVNILYLGLGTLRWIDPHSKDLVRHAPLVLIPVMLERATAKERFRLKWRQEDCSANLSLEAFLDRVHMLKLPAFPPGDDFDYTAYLAGATDVVTIKEGWSVQPDNIVLGFFSYAKFLMYRDLDPANWPADGKLTDSRMIRTLLQDGFSEQVERIADDANLDGLILPSDMRHIHDSDSSQVLAAHEARRGVSLVIQGPPGTGKSQTIANIIGEAVADGKTVLFVSEKMAALEVVKRRLDQAGLGEACLELHSNKANKKLFLSELRRTWELGAPKGKQADVVDTDLIKSRDLLNSQAFRMHQATSTSGLTPYEVVGQLARLQSIGGAGPELRLNGAEQWNANDRRERFRLAREITKWIEEEGRPSKHPWWRVEIESVLPVEADKISKSAAELGNRLREIINDGVDLARDFDMKPFVRPQDIASILLRGKELSSAPAFIGRNLESADWARTQDLNDLVKAGGDFADLTSALKSRISTSGWIADTDAARVTLGSLPGEFGSEWLARTKRFYQLLPQLISAAEKVRTTIRFTGEITDTSSFKKLLETARHVAAAPPAAPEIYTAAVWDHGMERATDLVDAVASLETARRQVGDQVGDGAWEADCGSLQQILASHGTSLLRWFSGEWRRANRKTKTLLRNPATELPDLLNLLGNIAKGQKARIAIHEGDAFGVAAFGLQWRGDQSTSASLRALSDWAGALGPRSSEIRQLVARVSDPDKVRVDVNCLNTIWLEFEELLSGVLAGLTREAEGSAAQFGFEDLKMRTEAIVAAEKICREVFIEVPERVVDQLELLRQLSCWRVAKIAVTEADELGRQCFGGLWKGCNSDWGTLGKAAQWVNANSKIRRIAARFDDPAEALARSERLSNNVHISLTDIEQLFQNVCLNTAALFGTGGLPDLQMQDLVALLERWGASRESLSKWIVYSGRAKKARVFGIGEVVDRLESGKLAPADAQIEMERAIYWAVLVSMSAEDPELSRFDGDVHQGHVDEFVRLEGEHRQASRVHAMRSHFHKIPNGGVGPVGTLKAEIARRRGHMPIRQLMSHAGAAIQALKPVMMMSPLSVAQFLTPGELKFDLLVMDEASQIQPVDALGAIARCRQTVVVGDEQQLPPTRFFSRMTGGQADEDDAELAQVADVESILGLFLARGAPQRTLRWHYRSEHHSLIAVSNREFYNDQLFVLPSPYTQEAGRGIRFHYLPEGIFDSGKTRTNAVEALCVAKAVMEHARLHPTQSLGVGTFSVAQRRAIQDQVELLRQIQPQSESFFSGHPSEPFFVKNLENIQGDERDVIFISVGYGKPLQGHMAMRFGPLSSQGGERRLNVLITRAKRRCEVFASITDCDIDLERAPGRGVAAFQLFLRFARTGLMDTVEAQTHDGANYALEEDVVTALRDRGYEIDTRVGVSGAFIDVAVLDSEHRGRYVLGIEFDGKSYSSARSTRDRDRLRGEALKRQGWKLYRVWSMDWYQRPNEQLERLVSAIEEEKLRLKAEAVEEDEQAAATVIERDDANTDSPAFRNETGMYVEACPSRPLDGYELLETSVQTLALLVVEIIEVEGPIHQDELIGRVRSLWGLQRTGPRIQEHVTKAIRAARVSLGVERDGKFLNMPSRIVRLRNRSGVASRNLKLPDMIAPSEIRAGVADVVRENFGAREDEIVTTVVRRLGYTSSSANLRDVVGCAIEKMRASGVLAEHGELLLLTEATAK